MTVRILTGDCRAMLATLPAASVHCCVTSPPYFGLRDYGTATWEGGEPGCDHTFRPDAGATSQRVGRSYQQGHPHRECKCGARRIDSQIGLEQTPDCRRHGLVKLRGDLTEAQRQYVAQRLLGEVRRDV